jgi:hypothetical protein
LSILTIVIQLELDDDTLIEVESGALDVGSSVAEFDVAIWLKKLTNLLWSDDSTKLALNEEETWRKLVTCED